MKKRIIPMLLGLGVGLAQAAVQNNVWTGQGGNNDFNYASNWWNSVTANDVAFFRGDFVEAFPARTNADLSADATITGIKFQASVLSNVAYNISGSAGTLTLDGDPEGQTTLIDVFGITLSDQTISADLVFDTINNANNRHVQTGAGGGLVLSGTVSQSADSSGLGIYVGNGDVELSGDVNGAGNLWKIRDNSGDGVFKLTGNGIWSGFGTVQIDNGAEILLSRSSTDSTGFCPGVFQILDGGALSLGNSEQMIDTLDVGLGSGTFNLNGYTETVRGLKFIDSSNTAILDMGDGGILRLANQNFGEVYVWGTLVVTNWEEGIDHIYVDGGSFSSTQLAAISFVDWSPAGAKMEGGELLPTGTFVGKTAFQTWADGYGVGAETEDPDGDGLVNVYEYGLGGDPTNAADRGISPSYTVDGGILTYIHPQLSDPESGLDYHLETREDLTFGSWTNAGYTVSGTNVVGGGFDYVTNEVSTTTKPNQFIKLIIDTL